MALLIAITGAAGRGVESQRGSGAESVWTVPTRLCAERKGRMFKWIRDKSGFDVLFTDSGCSRPSSPVSTDSRASTPKPQTVGFDLTKKKMFKKIDK